MIFPRTVWEVGDSRKTLSKAEGSPSFTGQGEKRSRITSGTPRRLHPHGDPGQWIPKQFLP